MAISFNDFKRPKCNHTRPQAPIISLDQPGRLRVAHVLSLIGLSHSTLYARIRMGRFPKPDGYDGKLPFWNTATVKRFLDGAIQLTPKDLTAPTSKPVGGNVQGVHRYGTNEMACTPN